MPLKLNSFYSSTEGSGNVFRRDSGHIDGHRHRCQTVLQAALHQRVAEVHRSGSLDPDIVPDPHVTASDRRHPIPADGRMECWVVGSQLTSVEVRTLGVFLLYRRVVSRLDDADSYHVTVLPEQVRDVKVCAPESAGDVSKLVAVEINLCLPVDSVEGKEDAVSRALRQGKRLGRRCPPVPEIRVEVGFGNMQVVVGDRRIRNRTGGDVAVENRSRHDGRQPISVVIFIGGDLLTAGSHRRGSLKLPLRIVGPAVFHLRSEHLKLAQSQTLTIISRSRQAEADIARVPFRLE